MSFFQSDMYTSQAKMYRSNILTLGLNASKCFLIHIFQNSHLHVNDKPVQTVYTTSFGPFFQHYLCFVIS